MAPAAPDLGIENFIEEFSCLALLVAPPDRTPGAGGRPDPSPARRQP